MNSIVTLQSGFPFTVTSGVDNARSGTGGQRADLIGDPNLSGGRSRGEQIAMWLNKDAFAPNALGTFGNQGRNMWRGPGLAAVDLGIQENFQATEYLKAQFRFEMFKPSTASISPDRTQARTPARSCAPVQPSTRASFSLR